MSVASRAAALLISLIGRNENGAGGGLTLSRETIVIVLRDLHFFGVGKRTTFEVFFRVPLRVSTS